MFWPDPTPHLRASDADREAAVERLRVAAGEGRIDPDELEERLTAAYRSRHCAELERLTADVVPPRPRAQRAVRAVDRRLNLLAVVSLVCAFMWMGGFGSLMAIVLGHVARGQIARSGGTQKGAGVALAGLAVGYIGLLAPVFFLAGVWMTFA